MRSAQPRFDVQLGDLEEWQKNLPLSCGWGFTVLTSAGAVDRKGARRKHGESPGILSSGVQYTCARKVPQWKEEPEDDFRFCRTLPSETGFPHQ